MYRWPAVSGCIIPCILVLALTGCGGREGFRPVDPEAAVFWDRQTSETAALLERIAAAFNAQHDGPPIRIEHTGGYSEIDRKVLASLRAGVLPALSVGYPGMTLQYIASGAVPPLDPLIGDPAVGLDEETLADYVPAALETNRYPQHGNRFFSFPFAKSVLVMYYHAGLLRAADIDAPPASWTEFLAQCRQIKARTGKYAYAIDVDCSTVNGFIYSMGGTVYREGATHYDSPEAVRVFKLYETIANEELGYQIAGGFDDQVSVSQGEAAFSFRSSAGRVQMAQVMAERMDDWGIARIPQADPENPATVLYGPNFILFDTTRAQRRTAWAFVKHFTSVDVQVRWAIGSGYVPVRTSALADPRLKAFLAGAAQNRIAFENLAFARAEPNVAGWPRVRDLVEQTVAAILAGRIEAAPAAAELKANADAALAEHAAP
ncbi:MAG: extracellular solute-binding protein [Candidatus Hydrogenedentota bacterium]